MTIPRKELVWRGRMHIGDGPGTYGDAAYVGLTTELPLTLMPFPTNDQSTVAEPSRVTLTLQAEDVTILPGQTGHPVTIVEYVRLGVEEAWTEREVATGSLTTNETTIDVDIEPETTRLPHPSYLGIRVGIDTAVAPGLYDDFVLTSACLGGEQYYGSLGYNR